MPVKTMQINNGFDNSKKKYQFFLENIGRKKGLKNELNTVLSTLFLVVCKWYSYLLLLSFTYLN